MALDVHVLRDGKPAELLFQIESKQYDRMQGVFELIKKRTGIYIDQYTDTKFNSGLEPLITVIRDFLQMGQEPTTANELNRMIEVLTKAQAESLSIIFCGD